MITKLLLPKPRKCVFSITNSCSMRCKMCYNWTQTDKDVLNEKRWIEATEELHRLSSDMLLNIIGGEPLESPLALKIIKKASSLNMKTSLTTNGSLIENEMVQKISESGLSTLCISLDSMEPEVHDYYRGVEGTHLRVMKALELFSKQRHPEIILQTIIMEKNLSDLAKIVEFANKHSHINGVYFMAVMKPHFTSLSDEWYLKDSKELWPNKQNVTRAIETLIKMKQKNMKIVNSISHLNSFKNYYLHPDRFIKSKNCDVSDFGIYIDSKGEVSICNEKGLIGNLKEKPLEKIWYSYESVRVKDKMKSCRKNCEFLVNCFYQDEK